jgi:outer membrane cobalamin receptor
MSFDRLREHRFVNLRLVNALPAPVAFVVKSACALLCLAVLAGLPYAVHAQQAQAPAVIGTVRSQDGKAISDASITLQGNGTGVVTRSDRAGRFAFSDLHAGVYVLRVSAAGYTTLFGRTVEVTGSAPTSLLLTLPNAQVSSLTTIGSATANGRSTLSTASAPMLDIGAQPYARQGVTRTSDILQDQLSTTVYPVLGGGGCNAPAVVALRGPDPSETLVDVDGHQVNNGSTGDFDLSLLDPADLQTLQVVYGIAPSSLYGPNTLGGAVNVVTLEPTAQTHTLLRLTDGSCGTFGETASVTGSDHRLGYAISYHRLDSSGEFPNNYEIPNSPGPDGSVVGESPVGDGMNATSTIEKLRYTFGRGGGFVGVTFRDQSAYRDLSATLSSVQPAAGATPASYDNSSGSSISSTNSAYDLDAQVPLGRLASDGSAATTAIFRHQSSLVNQSVTPPGAGSSPYLYNDRDLTGDDTLEIDHPLPHGLLALKGALTEENLVTDFIPGTLFADAVAVRLPFMERSPELDAIPGIPDSSVQTLSQTQRWLGILYQDDPTAKLHYSFAGYFSDYSTFGTSRDPRFGFTWTPNADSTVRLSVGSTFQSPQLPTFIIPPSLPNPQDGYVSIGNPNATAEHATSYNLGYEHLFAVPQQLHVELEIYRTDLHDGVATYFSPTTCPPSTDLTQCESYPVNVTQEVYQGLELRGDFALRPRTTISASYDIDSVYTEAYPASSADNVPPYEQSLGVPLHKIGLTVEHTADRGVAYYVGMLYEGTYNEQNLPPFATLRAGATWRLHDFDLGLYGTNLTDVYDFPLTRSNAGVPYGGLTSVVQTDAIPLAPRQITLSLSHQT